MSGGLLSVAAIAEDRGWDRTTAWRWLKKLERLHGAKLVRDKRTHSLCIERAELARVSALIVAAEKKVDPAVVSELKALRERVEEQESRINGLARDLWAIRRPRAG